MVSVSEEEYSITRLLSNCLKFKSPLVGLEINFSVFSLHLLVYWIFNSQQLVISSKINIPRINIDCYWTMNVSIDLLDFPKFRVLPISR